MLRFALLGSGSRGNATLVEAGNTRVMIDCGFSVVETEKRMARLGVDADSLDAILVTHEHGDHLRGVAPLAARYGIPVWMAPGTHAVQENGIDNLNWFRGDAAFTVGDLHILPFPVPHDAREPNQFVLSDGAHRLGVLTDTGSITPHIIHCLAACDAMVLECNHDEAMLADGPYPPSLKARVGGRFGHLSNQQAGDLLRAMDVSRLRHVVAAHLSDKNNTAELARTALADALDCANDDIAVADQVVGLGWRECGAG